MKNLAFIFLATLLASEAQAYEVPTNEYNHCNSTLFPLAENTRLGSFS